MKKQVLILILSITASLFSLTSCGNTAGAEEQINTEVEESVVYTPDPTPTATPESTPTATPTPTPTATPTPTPDPTATPYNGYYVEDDTRAYLKGLGATDEEIDSIKSDDDLATLITKLFGGGSSSSGGGSSSSADTGSSGATGEDVRDPSRDFQLDVGDGSLPGSMGSSESDTKDLPSFDLGQGTVGGYM